MEGGGPSKTSTQWFTKLLLILRAGRWGHVYNIGPWTLGTLSSTFTTLLASTFTGGQNKTVATVCMETMFDSRLFCLKGRRSPSLFSIQIWSPHIMTSSFMYPYDHDIHSHPALQSWLEQAVGHFISWPLHRKLHVPELFSTSCSLPPQICLDWLGHSTAMFYIPLAELDSGSNSLSPDAPICNCPRGTTSRGSQKNSDSSARQKCQGRIKATSQEAQVTFSSFKIHRIKCTVKIADCEVLVSVESQVEFIHPVINN